MWIDDDFIFPMEKTFGKMFQDGDFAFPAYPFYADGSEHEIELKEQFEQKFVRHFKYNMIGYSDVDMFKDHFEDIMYINYPKYRHYW